MRSAHFLAAAASRDVVADALLVLARAELAEAKAFLADTRPSNEPPSAVIRRFMRSL